MTEFGISPEDLRRMARLVEENGLSELRYEEGDVRITLRTGAYRTATAHASPATGGWGEDDLDADYGRIPPLSPAPSSLAPPLDHVSPANAIRIEAPVMGVFYRSAAPGAPPLIEIGDAVEVGQPVGLIEAMKVFSEVLAESAGVVYDIPAHNGALVSPGDTLVVLEVVA